MLKGGREALDIKTDLDWIKKSAFAVGLAVVIAALKYIFIG